MKNADEAVARVLAGLRDVEAPEGLERRILNGMEERAAARRSGWSWLRRVATAPVDARRWLLWGAAFAGMTVIGVAVPAVRRLVQVPVASKIGVKADAPLTRRTLAVGANDAASVPQAAKERVAESRTVRAAAEVRRADGAGANVAGVKDSVVTSEMRGASFPAPPMPLTEQERLLLRIAHKGDPVEVAILDPKMRSLQEMEERADYQRFFARPAIEQPSVNGVAGEQDGEQQKAQQQIPYGDDTQKSDSRTEQSAQQQLNKGEKQ
jgi:hypothetical protein